MRYLSLFFISSIISFSDLSAAVEEVELGDVVRTVSLEVTAAPVESVTLSIQPQEWSDYIIVEALAHGAPVEEGQSLITFKTTKLDQEIVDLGQEIELQTLALSLQQQELADLETVTPIELKLVDQEEGRDSEDYDYFVQTQIPQMKERYAKLIESSEWRLKNAQEELTQLKAMYEEDDLTEETEEIILKRAEYQAQLEQWLFGLAQESNRRSVETRLPRLVGDEEQEQEFRKFIYEKTRRTLTQALKKKQIETRQAELKLERANARLVKLQADRELMNHTAPAAGVYYYGVFQNYNWTDATNTEKVMKLGGKLSINKDYACIIPQDTKMQMYAQSESKDTGGLSVGQSGYLELAHDESSSLPVSIAQVGNLPLPNNKYLVTLNITGDFDYILGAKGKANITLEKKTNVLTLNKKALKKLDTGEYQVLVLPAKSDKENKEDSENRTNQAEAEAEAEAEEDVKPKPKVKDSKAVKRIVQVGVIGDSHVEILSGLVDGDRVETP